MNSITTDMLCMIVCEHEQIGCHNYCQDVVTGVTKIYDSQVHSVCCSMYTGSGFVDPLPIIRVVRRIDDHCQTLLQRSCTLHKVNLLRPERTGSKVEVNSATTKF